MKVATFGLGVTAGKYKYSCDCFKGLLKKFSPKKESPYVCEFIGEEFARADAIAFNKEQRLDFVLLDLERIEGRLTRTQDQKEIAFLGKAQSFLEKETLLCDCEFNEEEKAFLKNIQSVTALPALGVDATPEINALIRDLLERAGLMLFFTAGEKEVHAWELKKGLTILDAAGKIHSDLARGFIKGEVIDCNDLDKFFNLAEARQKGFAKAVDRDYVMQPGNIIEIKFSV